MVSDLPSLSASEAPLVETLPDRRVAQWHAVSWLRVAAKGGKKLVQISAVCRVVFGLAES